MAFIQLNYPSGALQQNTDVSIILPDPPGSAHVSPGRAYQTLYLLHGTYGDHSDWWRKTALERYAQEACLAVVMPSCGNAFTRRLSVASISQAEESISLQTGHAVDRSSNH